MIQITTKRENGSLRVAQRFEESDVSMTKQADTKSADINQIVKRLRARTPVVLNQTRPAFGNFTLAEDYMTALTRVRHAEEDFLALPSDLRKRFNNTPDELLRFLEDPENQAEAIELGIVEDPGLQEAELAALGAAIGGAITPVVAGENPPEPPPAE